MSHAIRLSSRWTLGWVVAALLLPTGVLGHAYAPGAITLIEQSASLYLLQVKRTELSAEAEADAGTLKVEACSVIEIQPSQRIGTDRLSFSTLRCDHPPTRFELAEPASRPYILRVRHRAGTQRTAVLPAGAQRLDLAQAPAELPAVFPTFFRAGLEHIAEGYDHLALVLLLVMLLRGRTLVLALSAFTVGHAISLTVSAASEIAIDPTWVEPAIAASIVCLAVQLARQLHAADAEPTRQGWLGYGAIGLLHGLGFSLALRDLGLPPVDFAAGVLGFNLGIEVGQLAFVAVLLLIWRAFGPVQPTLRRLQWLPCYAVGSLCASQMLGVALPIG